MPEFPQRIFEITIPITLLIILFTIFIYLKVIKPYRKFLYYKKILTASYKTHVIPYNIFGIGNFRMLKRDYANYGDSQYTVKHIFRNYQITMASFMGHIAIDLIDHELIKQFYQKQFQFYQKAFHLPFISSVKKLVGQGLVFSEGNDWKMKKKIMSNVFNFEFLKSKINLIAQICQQKIQQVQNENKGQNTNQVKIDVTNLFQRIFGNVVVKSFFGDIQLDKLEGQQIFTYINSIFEQNTTRSLSLYAFFMGSNFLKFNLRSIDKRVTHKAKNFKRFTSQTIINQIKLCAGKTQKNSYGGIIELLVQQQKVKNPSQIKENEECYSIQGLIDQFTTFFMAGTDTTSNSTSFLIYLLAQNRKVQQKLRKQIDEVFPSPFYIKHINYQNLKKLTYFDDVFKQTLRMYSPTAGIFARVALKDHYIGKIPIGKGTIVAVKIKPNHFKDEFYQNPFQFNPDRWVNDPSKTFPYSYFPFSSGQRSCIGQHLALLQSKIAVILLLKRYSKIKLEKQNFKKYMRTFYAAQQMTTTFQKSK